MKQLTQAEEQVMQVLWKIEKGFVKNILQEFPTPKPAYNTISTIVRILQKKGFVGYSAYGKSHEYFPLISQKEYSRKFLKRFIRNYFSNSYEAIASFLAMDKNISIEDLEEIKSILENEIKKQKGRHHE